MFHIGANAKDEIALKCDAFTLLGIGAMADPAIAPNKYTPGNTPIQQADLTKGFFGQQDAQGKWQLSTVRWMVDDPKRAQTTLAQIDRFIDAVDSKRAAFGAIQNHFPVISSPHKTSSKPDILAVLNSFERMATFRWFFCA